MKLDNNIENKYSFNAGYISNYHQFKKKILSKKIIPYQRYVNLYQTAYEKFTQGHSNLRGLQ